MQPCKEPVSERLSRMADHASADTSASLVMPSQLLLDLKEASFRHHPGELTLMSQVQCSVLLGLYLPWLDLVKLVSGHAAMQNAVRCRGSAAEGHRVLAAGAGWLPQAALTRCSGGALTCPVVVCVCHVNLTRVTN